MKRTTLSQAAACSFLACLTSTASFAALSPGDLQITEVMANPQAVSDTVGEWFEIYNTTANNIDLSGLTLQDSGSNQHVLGEAYIAAHSVFILGRNGDANVNGGVDVDYVYSGFTLSNSTDSIFLIDGTTTIASLSYSGDFVASGISREWIDGAYELTEESKTFGAGDRGTPGVTSAVVSEVPLPGAALLFASGLAGLIGRRTLSA